MAVPLFRMSIAHAFYLYKYRYMKRLLLSLLMLTSITANAQFLLTSTGFVDSQNLNKSYVVLESSGKTQQELYVATKTFIISNYNSPKNVMSENLPFSLSILGAKDLVTPTLGMPMEHELCYKIVFTFKDNRIKVEPYLVSCTTAGGLDVVLFNKKGEARKVTQKLLTAIQDHLNGIISSLKTSLEKQEQEEDW